jgi:hypothetical protein
MTVFSTMGSIDIPLVLYEHLMTINKVVETYRSNVKYLNKNAKEFTYMYINNPGKIFLKPKIYRTQAITTNTMFCHDCFSPYPFQFSIHKSSQYLTL